MQFVWELVQHDGTTIDIPPSAVDVVKRRMESGEPINTSAMVIPANQIKAFRITERRYGQQPLLEAAAQAFNEPMYTDDGAILAKWVKKPVPQRDYAKLYSAVPAYRKLATDGGMVVVAFILPIHEIDLDKVQECTESEVESLTRK